MEKNYFANGEMLQIGYHSLRFEYRIEEVLFLGDKFIVLLKIPPNGDDHRNICAVDSTAKIIWRVAVPQIKVIPSDIYVHMRVIDDNTLIAMTFWARRDTINIDNGEITKSELYRW
jgi:hypothetical protein